MVTALFTGVYVALAAAFFLSLALPYAGLKYDGDSLGFYLLSYAELANNKAVIPTTVELYGVALMFLASAAASLSVNFVWGRKLLRVTGNGAQTICLLIKPALVIVVVILFAVTYKYFGFYQTELGIAMDIQDEVTVGTSVVDTILRIASIGLLVTVLLDVLMSFRAYYITRKKA